MQPGAVAEGVGGDLGQRLAQDLGLGQAGRGGGDRGRDPGGHLAGGLGQHVVLGGEVPEEGPAADPGRVADVSHRHVAVPAVVNNAKAASTVAARLSTRLRSRRSATPHLRDTDVG